MEEPTGPASAAGAPPGTPIDLLPFQPLVAAWQADGGTPEAALAWTRRQVEACRRLVRDDAGWNRLLQVFEPGRAHDAWLAADWPDGFDELLLCAPLCQLVRFECRRCHVGQRQNGSSCAHPASLFGRIAVLLHERDRAGLLRHLTDIEALLAPRTALRWDVDAARVAGA
jgi:hypothetical protein